MDHEEDAGEIQERRQDGADDHFCVVHADHFRHQEGGSAHDGGHDLAACGGGRFHRSGELSGIAGLFHHRDGDGTGGDGVAHGGAGDHAAQSGGDDGDLSGATTCPAGDAVGAGDEEVTDAGGFQEGAEDDEQDDEGGTDTDGGADDTGGGIEQVVDDGFQRFPCHKGVDNKAAGHAEDGQTHHTAAALRQNQDADDAQHDLQIGDAGGTLEDALIVDDEIEEAAGADHSQDDVIPGDAVDLSRMSLTSWVESEHKQDHAAQEQRSSELFSPSCKQIHPHHEQRKGCQQVVEDLLWDSLIDTSIGFPVVLLHDLRHVVCRTYFHVMVDLRFDFGLGNHSFLVLKVCQIVRLLVYYFLSPVQAGW